MRFAISDVAKICNFTEKYRNNTDFICICKLFTLILYAEKSRKKQKFKIHYIKMKRLASILIAVIGITATCVGAVHGDLTMVIYGGAMTAACNVAGQLLNILIKKINEI